MRINLALVALLLTGVAIQYFPGDIPTRWLEKIGPIDQILACVALFASYFSEKKS
jgi:hypothetical protein